MNAIMVGSVSRSRVIFIAIVPQDGPAGFVSMTLTNVEIIRAKMEAVVRTHSAVMPVNVERVLRVETARLTLMTVLQIPVKTEAHALIWLTSTNVNAHQITGERNVSTNATLAIGNHAKMAANVLVTRMTLYVNAPRVLRAVLAAKRSMLAPHNPAKIMELVSRPNKVLIFTVNVHLAFLEHTVN